MGDKINIVRMDEPQIELATEMLARILNNHPVAAVFGQDPQARLRTFREGYRPLLQYVCAHGHPHVATIGGNLVGLALWMPPHGNRATPEEEKEFGLDMMPATFGESVLQLRPLGELMKEVHLRDMTGPHWFLPMLVVDPSHLGCGIASSLLRPVLARADDGQLPVYADTTLPDYVQFYERHGFRTMLEDVEPVTGIRFWTMRRDPLPAPLSES